MDNETWNLYTSAKGYAELSIPLEDKPKPEDAYRRSVLVELKTISVLIATAIITVKNKERA